MAYRARQGDIIWLSLDPQVGNEQKGRRPALVVSNDTFNDIDGMSAMICPITNTDRDKPLHLRLDGKTKTTGVVRCDQAKVLDLAGRRVDFIEKVPDEIIFEAVDIIVGIVEIDTPASHL
ncbi:MAG: type II toxin-antitoxin system PemK/MazF family toxin [Oscillospiraceae bacterium]|nr:type II toxin-antitoxin system PemK/MazF family toxin [Oscillospiraceae bacterium]